MASCWRRAGALLGVAAAVAGARLFSSLAYGVSVRDPLSLAAGPVLVLIAAFLAAAVPATRAVRVSPDRRASRLVIRLQRSRTRDDALPVRSPGAGTAHSTTQSAVS